MEARLEVERLSETMLRAADAPEEEDRLLRPAGSHESNPDNLLRTQTNPDADSP